MGSMVLIGLYVSNKKRVPLIFVKNIEFWGTFFKGDEIPMVINPKRENINLAKKFNLVKTLNVANVETVQNSTNLVSNLYFYR